jgi:hypothetical protein
LTIPGLGGSPDVEEVLLVWELLLLFAGSSVGVTTAVGAFVKKHGLVRKVDLDEVQARLEEARRTAAASERGREAAAGHAAYVTEQFREAVDLTRDIEATARGVECVDAKVAALVSMLSDRGSGAAGGNAEDVGPAVGALAETAQQILDLLSEESRSQGQITQMSEMLHVSRKVEALREDLGRHVLSDEELGTLRAFLGEVAAEERGERHQGQHRGQHRQPDTGPQLFAVPHPDGADEERSA